MAGSERISEDGNITRRNFLKISGALGVSLAFGDLLSTRGNLLFANEAVMIENPLGLYPAREWEKVYRNIYQEDSHFHFLCSPNDTHNCLLKAHVKNGVVVRISPSFRYGEATDLAGNKASHRWDPRACQRGLMLARRFYGDRRVKGAMIRQGFKKWADADFPRDAKTGKPKMDVEIRGEDKWLQIEWDDAYKYAAKAYLNIATTYTGEKGAEYLKAQDYDPDMIETMEGAGTKTLKARGGMPLLGIGRIMGFYRFSNMMALLDENLRKDTPREKLFGGRQLDSYTWHTDLPPGHPMVTGHQTVEFDLAAAENAKLIITFGMNWLATKMPDAHWLSEAKLKGTRVINVSTDYQATSQRADEVVMIRPGTDLGLLLGMCRYIIEKNLYDAIYVKERTDLPLLVRLDNKKLLSAGDVIPGYKVASLKNFANVVKDGTKSPPAFQQNAQIIPESLRNEWGDFTVWDIKTRSVKAVSRDQVGKGFAATGIDPALTGEFEVTIDGKKVKVKPVFDHLNKYLLDNFDLQTTSELTWADPKAIESLAKQVAANRKSTLLTCGMGPNHFFNADLKDRAVFLLAALTDNIGYTGGNVGSYAGNYRTSVFSGAPQYIFEDPFNINLDASKPATVKKYVKPESAHFYNYGDRPLKAGNKNFTGKTHMPTPTKVLHFGNSNSLLGNAKWHYDVVANTLPGIEAIFVHEWWWTASCEYADIVFGVDSWAEHKFPDMTGSCTNSFLQVFPRTPLKRIHDTRSDYEVLAGVGKEIGELVNDKRFTDYWKFVHDNNVEAYLQRVLNAGNATRGYKIAELEAKAKEGVPALMMFRTYPRTGGWEHVMEDRPWYNRTGRLEFYRDEPEFIEYGENLPVFREPVDATYYDPNAILGKPHPMLDPTGPEKYGLKITDRDSETRQIRNVMLPWDQLKVTKHPLTEKDKKFEFVFISPKYRWGAHTTPIDLDWIGMMFGPFGDMYRRDKRKPWTGEGYMEINPGDAKRYGIEDGDYVWFHGDPKDRPYRDWKKEDAFYNVSKGMARARYHSGIQPGVIRMYFNMYVATKGSVKGQKTRKDGLAKNPDTKYQSYFRHGSHQSATRAWLRPTLLTDSLTRKPVMGQEIGKGFESDVHCANGAPKESFIKIEKAEDGGMDGKGLWGPADKGFRARYESDAYLKYLRGEFMDKP